VIGSVRDSKSPNYDELKNLPAAEGSRLILVTLDSSKLEDPAKAIRAAEDAGITHVDIVIANAGISPAPQPLESAALDEVVDSLQVNTVSPIALYQASKPLLDKSSKPIWMSMSSAAGSITNLPEYQAHWILGYGISKAAMDWFTVAVHAAHPNLIAYAIHPGLVQTDLGNSGAKMQGLEKAPVTLEDSCAKIIASVGAIASAHVRQSRAQA
jgi:NAD(P)-dependent dehydrogenase (short-subunit alcohol dehydrogenase family)